MKMAGRRLILLLAGLAVALQPGCGGKKKPGPEQLFVTTTALPNAIVGEAYSETLETTGGTPPFTWEVTTGELPPDFTFSSSGILSGMPAEISFFSFGLRVTDSATPPQINGANLILSIVSATTGNAILVSAVGPAIQPNEDSTSPSSDATGRYVAFSTRATNLDQNAPDLNGALDIFVRDTCRTAPVDPACIASTIRASLASDGAEADGDSVDPSISGDGRFVAFASLASNLVTGDTNGNWDIFVRDTCLGQDPAVCTPSTQRVSVAADGTQGAGDSVEPSMSADGRFVAFRSLANDLIAGDINGAGDIFVRDTCRGVSSGCTPTTVRASVATDGSEATGNSLRPSLSPDGRFVAFESLATNLATGDANGASDIFLRDTCLGAGVACTPSTLRVSLAGGGAEANSNNFQASVNNGGRFVAFESSAGNLVAGDTNATSDVFLRDTCTGAGAGCVPQTVRMSIDLADAQFDAISIEAAIDASGRFVAFQTAPVGLDPADFNGASEIYVRDTCRGGPVDCVPATIRVSVGPDGQRVNGDCSRPTLSADGTAAVFRSLANNLVLLDSNNDADIFLVDIPDLIAPPPPP